MLGEYNESYLPLGNLRINTHLEGDCRKYIRDLDLDTGSFQIDGNFGGLAGIAHMLLQTEEHLIKILPALPCEWKEGKVKGLRGKGDLTISIAWDKNDCIAADICTGRYDYKGRLVYGRETLEVELCAGERRRYEVVHKFFTKKLALSLDEC